MLKIAKMTDTVHTHTHTHTQAYLENNKEIAYQVCFKSNVYKTDQF